MDKVTFLAQLDESRRNWEKTVAQIPQKRLSKAIVFGDWTAKDLIAHVVWYEQEMLNLLESNSLSVASPYWMEGTDERNRLIYEENQQRSWDNVLTDYAKIYSVLRAELGKLTDEQLNQPAEFEMPNDWLPFEIFAQNTYEHYDHHLPDLRKLDA